MYVLTQEQKMMLIDALEFFLREQSFKDDADGARYSELLELLYKHWV